MYFSAEQWSLCARQEEGSEELMVVRSSPPPVWLLQFSPADVLPAQLI